ncbi:cyclic nucleotide-binding domain-containing protein [Coniochaeta ligniaria NRRL 30616]|uniref:Cyclic nucleotide-binding domain-containing protein n=1 Tax=Coniochaeta ligniaria NRRL 30616 TaxID=1408157 RepID=A0A1J7J744_9PEZI|nr:cyclic nucleotide-binding domain-containing protein [Coniochaeta ligniaria NRRL 30616]
MSSPFSSWRRRRTPSISSQDTPDDSSAIEQSIPPSSSHAVASDARALSTSATSASQPISREPIRSFIHGSVRDHLTPLDSAQYARSVRQDTAELATYLLSDKTSGQSPAFLARTRSLSNVGRVSPLSDDEDDEDELSPRRSSDTIAEESEPSSPETVTYATPNEHGPSIIASMLRNSPPENEEEHPKPQHSADDDMGDVHTETTPLLPRRSHGPGRGHARNGSSHTHDVESQKIRSSKRWYHGFASPLTKAKARILRLTSTVRDPRTWDRQYLWQNVVVAPVVCLPAVIVGLLLNILDALSYGMILFPLGSPIFASLGSAGISIFYVSTIVSQLTFSCGSIFKGGVGSELIEVVPFFHSMAATITDLVGEENPEAVIATTITSYALSAMLTGTVFFLMGQFKFGYLVGFIPRHILIGCIGGVGWFLVATGFEVSARMDGSLNYDLDTLRKLFQADTAALWLIPLVLALILFYTQTKITSKFFLPLYIIAIPIVFYFFVLSLDTLDTDNLRDKGWIFEGPPPGEPWWYFYTLYQFDKVHWGAIFQCIPAMLALTFFGILHVPINVPALALNTGEDHADLDHELKLHGYSNLLSGCFGSIQNYLVYANTLFFMRSGGDSRLAGFELAALTFGVMVMGPSLIGFIPVMMVGVLIFDLGFELLLEAVWLPRKKLKPLEYFTVIVIVLVMGIYDFVVGIGVGILLAFIALIFQTSRVSAVRATYSGEVVGSTVRRNHSQQDYLRQVGRQIYVIKLAGFLFFGTINTVEGKIRALISDEVFNKRPIKYLVLDMCLVTGLDYSAGEAFNTISRLLDGKGVLLVLSGVDAESELGRNLRSVGLGEAGIDVVLLPDLNSALEYCENELLKTFYANQEARASSRTAPTASLDVPGLPGAGKPRSKSFNLISSSPRRNHLHEAAQHSLNQMEVAHTPRWQSFKEPLRLMLQIFQGLSDKNEDFWFRAVKYFRRQEAPAGTVLFRRGEPAEAFYLIESGLLRAEYDLPQGWLCESIVAGTTCGELPFFSETTRTATAMVEADCVLWLMDAENWVKLQKEEPDVAQELLRISLKLTSERMNAITSFVLTMAG